MRAPARLLLLAATSVLSTLAVAELAVRILSPMPPLGVEIDSATPLPMLRYERSAFSRHVLPATQHQVLRNGRLYRINDKGYRGEDFDWVKPEGTVRVLVYGGSAVFDILADDGRDWPTRVQNLLASRGHRNVRVINAGVPGHASFDSLGRLLAEGHRMEPDYVILYNAWNDIKTFHLEESLLRGIPAYRPKRDWVRVQSGPVDGALASLSHIYRHVRIPLHARSRGQKIGREGAAGVGEAAETFEAAQLEQYRLTLATFVDLVRNMGAEPLLVTQARLVTADNDEAERRKISYGYVRLTHDGLVRAFDATDRTAREIGAEKGVAVIDAHTALSARSELFHDQVHLSAEGSAALAALVADELDERL